MWRLILLLLAQGGAAGPAPAETVVASRNLKAQQIIGPEDVELAGTAFPGGLSRLEAAIGQEARVMLYAGRPILPDQLGLPARVTRNQPVLLVYVSGGLRIEIEGRALDRAAIGETVRVMNLGSRRTVRGIVLPDGSVAVRM